MSFDQGVAKQNIGSRTVYLTGDADTPHSWREISPEAAASDSSKQIQRREVLVETDITLDDAKITSVQNTVIYTATNQYFASVDSDDRTAQEILDGPNGIDEDMTGKIISWNGTTWRFSEDEWFIKGGFTTNVPDVNSYPVIGPDAVLTTGSLQEQGDRVFARKQIQTTSGSLFLGDVVALEDNAGFASYINRLSSDTGNIFGYRPFTRADGTEDFNVSVRLGEEEFGTFQPGFDETETVGKGEFISAVFTQLQDAFNYAHIFRGTSGQLVFNLYVDPQNRDLPPSNFTDAQMLALPRTELLKLVDSNADFVDTVDFDNPDDPGNDADTITYKVPRDFAVGRKLVIDWTTPNDNPVTVKGDTIGGIFIPYFQTFFADRFIDRIYPDRVITLTETTTLDAPYKFVIGDTTSSAFDITTVDATLNEGASMTFKKELGTTNDLTVKAALGQTIEGLSEIILSGDDGPVFTIFSDGTADWQLANIREFPAAGGMSFSGNATVTTINDPDVYEEIAGTVLAAPINNQFTVSTNPNILTYTGPEDVTIFGSCSITALRDSGAAIRLIEFTAFLNGSPIQAAGTTIDITNIARTSSFPVITILSTGDEIEVQARNLSDSTNVLVTDFGLIVFGIDR